MENNIKEIRKRIVNLRCTKEQCCGRDNCPNPSINMRKVISIIDVYLENENTTSEDKKR